MVPLLLATALTVTDAANQCGTFVVLTVSSDAF
jgi:hypothetical protein